MLHYVDKLVANFVSLLFGDGHVVHCGVYKGFFTKKNCLLCLDMPSKAMRVNRKTKGFEKTKSFS